MLGLLCVIPGIALALLIGSAILRGAVYFFNKFSASNSPFNDDEDTSEDWDDVPKRKRYRRPDAPGVPEPSLGHGMLIVFVSSLIQMAAGFVLGLLLVGAGAAGGNMFRGGAGGMEILINIISAIIGFLTLACTCTFMLPTTFPRALGVAAIYYVIGIIIAVIIGVLVFGVMFAAQ